MMSQKYYKLCCVEIKHAREIHNTREVVGRHAFSACGRNNLPAQERGDTRRGAESGPTLHRVAEKGEDRVLGGVNVGIRNEVILLGDR